MTNFLEYTFPEEDVISLLQAQPWQTIGVQIVPTLPAKLPAEGILCIRATSPINHEDVTGVMRVYPMQIAAYAPYEKQAKIWLEELYQYFDKLKSQTCTDSPITLAHWHAGMLQVTPPQFTGDALDCNGARDGKLYKYVVQLYLEMVHRTA